MASITSTSIAAIFLLSICLLSPNTCAHEKINNPLVFKACKKTLFYEKCLSTYASNPKTNSCKTMTSIAKLAIEAAMKKVESTAAHINSLKKQSSFSMFKQGLTGCSNNYVSVKKELKFAMGELNKPNGKSAQVVMSISSAMSAVGLCNKAFSMEFSEKKSISMDNLECLNLCSNAIAIAKILPS